MGNPPFYDNLFTIDNSALLAAAQGGAIIAVAATIYYALFGSILGMSGLTGSLVKFPTRHATKLKAIIVLGIILASALVNYIYRNFPEFNKTMNLPFDNSQFTSSSSVTHLAVAGLLVGLGTDLSNGCTSGHGLCGLPRFSIRSLVAVLTFLSTAIATASLSLEQYIPQQTWLENSVIVNLSIPLEIVIGFCLVSTILLIIFQKQKSFIAKLILFLIGICFGFGLMEAGMSKRTKIYGFLKLDSNWDPSLLFVLMTGVAINIITFNLILKFIKKPTYGQHIENPHSKLNFKLIIGAILFGLGWGIGGLCPGPFLLSIPYSLKVGIAWGIPFLFGQKLSNVVFGQKHSLHSSEAKAKHH